jgi:hypothetical protein
MADFVREVFVAYNPDTKEFVGSGTYSLKSGSSTLCSDFWGARLFSRASDAEKSAPDGFKVLPAIVRFNPESILNG